MSPMLSDDQRTLYVAAQVPGTGNNTNPRFNVFVLTRNGLGMDWGAARVTNLDSGGDSTNQTDELDLRYFAAEGRFWFTFIQAGYARIESAELQTAPHFFRDFIPEVAAFPETNQQYRGAALSGDGLILVSSHFNVATQKWNLVERTRPNVQASWSTQTPLTALSSSSDELDAWMRPDGLFLLYASNRGGDFDIYCSHRSVRTAAWQAPVVYGGASLHTAGADERAPFLFNRELLFSRRSGPGPANVSLAR
ncbi:MAG: hypothetical protein FJ298_16015 [Planctomycetes bacterium]|nr:hypothetical protein [Planctomycetota bacterium]